MRRGWKALVGSLIGAMPYASPFAAQAQTPFNESGSPNVEVVNVGGTPTIDLILIKAETPSVPLRNGGVIHGSEKLQLDGKVLTRGIDYQLDAEAGVIYLMRTPRPGEALVVSYRYEPSKAKAAGSQFAGFSNFKFDIAPGGFNLGRMMIGMGVTERRQDGNVITSNLYGWNNKIKLGNGALTGLMMVGEKDKVNAKSAFEYQSVQNPNDLGRSQFIVQNLQTGLLGGTVEASYQDISKNFSGFSAAQEAGFDAAALNQLSKERGLKRMGFSLKGLDFGGLKMSNSFRSVEDGEKSIDWRSAGLSFGGLSLDWSSRHVDQGFRRFNDLAEGERAQLQKEAGMTRDTFAAAFASKAAKMSLNIAGVEDPEGHSIKRSEFKIDAQKFRFTFGEQEVPKDFTRMNSLMDLERASWGRELGIERQWASLEASLIQGAPFKFSQNILRSDTGSFGATDFDVKLGTWSLQHTERGSTSGFNSFGAMQDGERNEHIAAITRMYDPKGFGIGGNDAGWFMRGSGISRSLDRISGEPFKGWNLSFEKLDLSGKQDGGSLERFSIVGKNVDFSWKAISLGEHFSDVSNLMDFERARLGTIAGLDQQEFGLNLALGKGKLSLGHMSAETPLGDASRDSLTYASKDINVSANIRSVDSGFINVNQLADPEKDLLAALQGTKERDIKASWQILPTLKLEAFEFAAEDPLRDHNKHISNQRVTWKPNKSTQLGYVRLDQKYDDPLSVLFANITEQFNFNKDFGRLGKLTYLSLTRDYDGTLSSLPDSDKRFYSYEAKLDPKTTLRAEQTDTKFDDGNHESIRASTVSSEIGKGTGVSVTDVKVDRQGTEHDEAKQNVGLWFELGGIRFSFGKAKNLTNGQATLAPSMLNVSETGLAQMAQGAAPEQLWAEQDNEAMTYQIASGKPMKFSLLSDMQFKIGFDSARDRSRWLRENKNVNWSAKLLGTYLGFDYKGQMAPNGQRASDRAFTITTDQAETKPFRASFFYKTRDLPGQTPVIIRNFSLVAKPAKNVEISHQLLTNPEVARGDVILGSITQANQLNRWKLDVKQNPNLIIGGSFEQIMDQQRPLSRVGGINVTWNQGKGSPVKLFYGLEQSDRGGSRYTTQRYSLGFDQKPGPNQLFSVFVGNVSYQHTIASGQQRSNWTIRVDYQLKF